MNNGLAAMTLAHRSRLATVSPEVPLLSNLSVWGNIALIPQYHQGLSTREAKARAFALLERFSLAGIAEKRNPSLTADERFLVMVLRAAAVQNAVLLLDRPFQILTGLHDDRFLAWTIAGIEDVIAEAHIFDYTWEKQRYRDPDDAAN